MRELMKMRQFRSTESDMTRWRTIRLPMAMPSDFSAVCRYALDRLYESLATDGHPAGEFRAVHTARCTKCARFGDVNFRWLCLACHLRTQGVDGLQRGSELPTSPPAEPSSTAAPKKKGGRPKQVEEASPSAAAANGSPPPKKPKGRKARKGGVK